MEFKKEAEEIGYQHGYGKNHMLIDDIKTALHDAYEKGLSCSDEIYELASNIKARHGLDSITIKYAERIMEISLKRPASGGDLK